MPSKCTVIIDSCTDLNLALVNKENVEIINFTYTTSEGEFVDDFFESTSPHDFYEAMRGGENPTTSQLGLHSLLKVFTKLAKENKPSVFMCFSGGLSGSYQVALTARDQVITQYPDAEIHIVDTLLASGAEGLLVMEALRLHDNGLSASELADWALEARYYVNAIFTVDGLGPLERGGRIPSSIAFAGSKLDVRPMLTLDLDGKIALSGVSRGRKKSINFMLDYYQKNTDFEAGNRFAMVLDADCKKESEKITSLLPRKDKELVTLEHSFGPVIGSHLGPGAVGLVFWGKDRRDNDSVANRIARKIKNN